VYSLTAEGEILKPIIELLCRWSTAYAVKRDIKVPLDHLPE
jgi:DNA-binding HxlR family transcriptional regulator